MIGDESREFSSGREAKQSARMIRRRKSLVQTEIARTHGLPKSDDSMSKGQIFRALLAPMRPGRLLDLGAGKGNFSLIAVGLGWQVTAGDARTTRFPNPDTERNPEVAERIRSIRWIQADVRQFPIRATEYDLICILGLLHHLELGDQIDVITRCAGTLLLLDTRIAPAALDREGHYEGMLVKEHGDTDEERAEVPTAAWGNAISFRHTEGSLLRLLRECGYARVMSMWPPYRRDYTYYLSLPVPRVGGRLKKTQ